ncbi:hypothetical protein JXB31_00885 [Candidatus Woesearchaeota archaeon]|nr:hypothetical protein [Candidatus Woesearchaeota archaeon]
MAETSVFRDVLSFFERLGVYDVVLPFLLVFVIFFAILERTKVFGTEEFSGKSVSKKNLNAMVAFVVAFLVIASSKMVAIINESMPNIVLLVLVSVSFLLLIGTFYKEGEDVYLTGGWRTFMMVLMFIGVVAIFAHAIPYNGQPWLEWFWGYLKDNYSSTAVSAIIMVIILVVIIFWATKDRSSAASKSEKE